MGIELNHEKISYNLLFPKIIAYTLLGTLSFFNLTTVPAAYCLLPTAFVLSFGTFQNTSPKVLPTTRR
jgi:hypothetical protein